jgi:hypothetical protein
VEIELREDGIALAEGLCDLGREVKNSIWQWYEKFQRYGCLCIARIESEMLRRRVWAEMDYRLYVCRVTNGGHIEHL